MENFDTIDLIESYKVKVLQSFRAKKGNLSLISSYAFLTLLLSEIGVCNITFTLNSNMSNK